MDNIVIETPVEPTEDAPVSDKEESETSAEEEETEKTEGEEEKPEGETEEEAASKKLTAQERIRQIIEQRNADRAEFQAKLAALEAKVQAPPAKPEPEFIEITPEVSRQVNAALAEFDRLRVEAELEGNYLQAVEYKKQFDTILEGLNENQKRMQTAKEREAEAAKTEQLVKSRAYNAEILRQQLQVPADDWKRAGEWFTQECQKAPAIAIQFQEIEARQGTMAAINYAYSVVVEKMGKPAVEAAEKKENKPVSLTSTVRHNVNDLRDDLPTDEWMRRRKKQLSRTG